MTSRSRLLWVAGLLSTYVLDGKPFGPSEKPIQVPEALAVALGLREVEAPTEGEAAAPTDTSALQERVDTLTKDRDDLKKELDDLKARAPEGAPAALPANARDLLIAIPGIGEKLADKVLEVLQAPAPSEETPSS